MREEVVLKKAFSVLPMASPSQKIWIKTYGCQMNSRDSDTLKALLIQAGHVIVENEKDADIALMNTCSVRDLAELKAIGKAGRLLKRKEREPNFHVGILGCMAARRGAELLKVLPNLDWIVPPQALPQVPKLIYETLTQNKHTCTVAEVPKTFDFTCYEQKLPPKPVLFIPIQQGCSMHCSYCIVPKTRGHQQNRPFDGILAEIRQATQNGTREIQLLGQIVNAYVDKEAQKNFVDLLEAVQAIDGIERIRFMSPHPSFFNNELIAYFGRLSKLCPALHLPIQSGSDHILKQMHRGYTREGVLKLIKSLRTVEPRISISTDLIVGYPGETDEDFEQTVSLFKEIDFDMAYIFKYSPRPTTEAASSEEIIPEDVKEERNQCLLALLNETSTAYNKTFVDTQQEVLIEGTAPHGEYKLFGRNRYNKKVIFDGSASLIGSFREKKKKKATSSSLEGRIVD